LIEQKKKKDFKILIILENGLNLGSVHWIRCDDNTWLKMNMCHNRDWSNITRF